MDRFAGESKQLKGEQVESCQILQGFIGAELDHFSLPKGLTLTIRKHFIGTYQTMNAWDIRVPNPSIPPNTAVQLNSELQGARMVETDF